MPLKEATRAGKRQSERKFVYRDEGNNISVSQLLNQQKRAFVQKDSKSLPTSEMIIHFDTGQRHLELRL